ncbi:MAG: hypothetical protein V5A68_06770 [Candidatus Thermoplasmatota archaeon]
MKKKKVSLLVVLVLIPLGFNAFQAVPVQKEKVNDKLEETYRPGESQATVLFHEYNKNKQKLIKEPIKNLSVDEGFQLKEELVQIEEENLTSLEKIQAQIQRLKE